MTFASVKLYSLISLISRIAQLVLIQVHNSIDSVHVHLFVINMLDILIFA